MSSNTPEQSNPGPPKPSEPPSSVALGGAARAARGLVGAAAGVGGVIGVFTRGASSIGVPVLLALGAFFGYLAVSGQRLRSLKMGEYEAAFDRIAHAVTHNVLENPAVPVEAKGDVAEALGEVRAEQPAKS